MKRITATLLALFVIPLFLPTVTYADFAELAWSQAFFVEDGRDVAEKVTDTTSGQTIVVGQGRLPDGVEMLCLTYISEGGEFEHTQYAGLWYEDEYADFGIMELTWDLNSGVFAIYAADLGAWFPTYYYTARLNPGGNPRELTYYDGLSVRDMVTNSEGYTILMEEMSFASDHTVELYHYNPTSQRTWHRQLADWGQNTRAYGTAQFSSETQPHAAVLSTEGIHLFTSSGDSIRHIARDSFLEARNILPGPHGTAYLIEDESLAKISPQGEILWRRDGYDWDGPLDQIFALPEFGIVNVDYEDATLRVYLYNLNGTRLLHTSIHVSGYHRWWDLHDVRPTIDQRGFVYCGSQDRVNGRVGKIQMNPVSVNVVHYGDTPEIPHEGGSLQLHTVMLNLADPLTVDAWIDIEYLPTGETTTLLVEEGLTLPHGKRTRNPSIQIPSDMPTGEYRAHVMIGDYLAGPINRSSLRFTKTNDGGDLVEERVAGADSAIQQQSSGELLDDVHPNPFNATTSCTVKLNQAGQLRVAIFDVLGREVANLADGSFQAGRHTFTWDANPYPTGMYLLRVSTASLTEVHKLLLQK